jgi:type IV pilus assembly protein PilN
MRFTINLATRTYLDHGLINRILGGTLLFLLLLLAWKVMGFCANMGELERLNADIAALEGSLGVHPSSVSGQEFESQQKTIRFYNRIIERKAFGWLELLERLENATPGEVSLAAFSPDAKDANLLKIEGRARNFGQVRSYLERLEGSGAFGEILLLSHADLDLGEKGRGVGFSISCREVKP